MLVKFLIVFIVSVCSVAHAQKGTAQLTYYHSYAPCCKDNPNYNPRYV